MASIPEAPFQPSSPSAQSVVNFAGEATLNPKPEKINKGRRKIPIKKIESKSKKHVTFSKRRKGLFRKASELCKLCGASVAIVTFSEAGKVFSFGHPSPDAVIHRYLYGSNPTNAIVAAGGPSNYNGLGKGDPVLERESIGQVFWWDRSIEDLGFEQLVEFGESLEKLRYNMLLKIQDLDIESKIDDERLMIEYEGGMASGMSEFLPLPLSELESDVLQLQHFQQQQEQQNYPNQFQCGCGCMTMAGFQTGYSEF